MFLNKKINLRSNIAFGSLRSLIVILLTLASYPIILNLIGIKTYGLWIVITTIVSLIQIGSFGIGPTTTKIISEYGALEDKSTQLMVFKFSCLLAISIGLLCASLMVTFDEQFLILFKIESEDIIIVRKNLNLISPVIVLSLLNQVLMASISGYGKFHISSFCELSSKFFTIIISILLLYFQKDITSMVIGLYCGNLFQLFFGLYILFKQIQFYELIFLKINKKIIILICKSSAFVFINSILSIFISPINKIIISRFVGIEYVTIYEIVYNGCMQLRNIGVSGLQALIPEISGLQALKDYRRIHKINTQLTCAIVIISVPIFFISYFTSELFLELWLGSNYSIEFVIPFNIMMSAILVSLVGVPSFLTLISLGFYHYATVSCMIQSFCNVIIIFLLVLYSDNIKIDYIFVSLLCSMLFSTIFITYKFYKLNGYEK